MAKRDPLFVDASGGAPTYSGLELRAMLEPFQAGILPPAASVNPTDFKVTAGAGLTLDSAPGTAVIQANQGGVYRPGKYLVTDDAAENSAGWERQGGGIGIPANGSANPRLDAVVLQQYDATLGDGSARRDWVRKYVPGVAAGGAALGGALPALPNNSELIAEVLVPGNNPATIPAANIRDRRKRARGFTHTIVRTTNVGGTSNYSLAGTATLVDATNLNRRFECGGGVVRMRVLGQGNHNMTAFPQYVYLALWVDGARPADSAETILNTAQQATAGVDFGVSSQLTSQPVAGSHLFGPAARFGGGNATLYASPTTPLRITFEEEIRPLGDNT